MFYFKSIRCHHECLAYIEFSYGDEIKFNARLAQDNVQFREHNAFHQIQMEDRARATHNKEKYNHHIWFVDDATVEVVVVDVSEKIWSVLLIPRKKYYIQTNSSYVSC